LADTIQRRREALQAAALPALTLPEVESAGARPEALTAIRKRALDVAAAALMLLVFSPLWLLCALLIKLTSRGPVIFRQVRIGAGEKPFTVYKFRTMRADTTDDVHRDFVTNYILGSLSLVAGSSYKLRRDQRITAIGRILRKLSLDEVPQLINVLRGEMSIVGPRPPLPYEVENYEPWQLARLTVRPGITGLWQVSGRNRLSFAEMCELDLQYIQSWTLRGDLSIMVRTPWVMLVDAGGAE
jgi:lipopolysaccharide/colanic/teichoic acid biosynthesis glycosyltransferase